MSKVAIFASGSGSNAENIVKYFEDKTDAVKFHFFTNNSKAYVNERARKLNVNLTLFTKDEFYGSSKILDILKEEGIDLIVLAGFLWLVPKELVREYPNKIINIHPALLPKYGGKGMYGKKIHEAVVANNEFETGITIHYVDENYDEGKIILQEKIKVNEGDTAEIVEAKIHELEYLHYPRVVEGILARGN